MKGWTGGIGEGVGILRYCAYRPSYARAQQAERIYLFDDVVVSRREEMMRAVRREVYLR